MAGEQTHDAGSRVVSAPPPPPVHAPWPSGSQQAGPCTICDTRVHGARTAVVQVPPARARAELAVGQAVRGLPPAQPLVAGGPCARQLKLLQPGPPRASSPLV